MASTVIQKWTVALKLFAVAVSDNFCLFLLLPSTILHLPVSAVSNDVALLFAQIYSGAKFSKKSKTFFFFVFTEPETMQNYQS